MGPGAALSDEGKMDHARGFSDHTKRYKGRAVRCQVPGCTEEVVNKAYHKRYRICQMHCNLPSVNLGGQLQRWCQQCGRFQPLSDFEGDRKTCKAKLEQHNSRRRTARSKARKDDDMPEHLHLQHYQQHRATPRGGGGLLGHDYGGHQPGPQPGAAQHPGSSSYSGHSDLAGASSSSLDAAGSPAGAQAQAQRQQRRRRRRLSAYEDGMDEEEMYGEQEEAEEQQHGQHARPALALPSAAHDRAHDFAKGPAPQQPPQQQVPRQQQGWPRQDFSPGGKGAALPTPPPLFQPPAPPQPSQQPALAAGTAADAAAPGAAAPGPAPWEQLLAVVAAPRSKAQPAWHSPAQHQPPLHHQPRQQEQPQPRVVTNGDEQPRADALAGAGVIPTAGQGFRWYASQQEQRVAPPSTRQAYEAGLLGSASAAAAAASAGGLPKELPVLNSGGLWASRGPSSDGAGRHVGGAPALRDTLPVPLGQQGLASAGAIGEPAAAAAAQLLPLLNGDSQLQLAAAAGSAAARGAFAAAAAPAAASSANPALPAQILQDLAALPGGSELATIVVASALAQQQQRRQQQPGPARAHDHLASFGLDESLQGLLSVGADPSSLASLPAWMSWPPGVFQQGSERAGVDDTAPGGAPPAAAPLMPSALPLPGAATATGAAGAAAPGAAGAARQSAELSQLSQLEPLMSLLGVACGMGGSAPAVLQTQAANGLLRAALPQQRRAASPPPAWGDQPRPSTEWSREGQRQQQSLGQPRQWHSVSQQQQQRRGPSVGLSAFSAPPRQGTPPAPGFSVPGAAWAVASDPGPACSSFWSGIRPSLQPRPLLRAMASQPAEGPQPQQLLEQQRRWQEVWEAQQTGRQLAPGISSLVTGSGASVDSLAVRQPPAAGAVGSSSMGAAKQLDSGGKEPGLGGLQGQLDGCRSGVAAGEGAALLDGLAAADMEEFVERAAQLLLNSSPDKLAPSIQAALLQLAASVAVAAEADVVRPAPGEATQGTPSQQEAQQQLAQPGIEGRTTVGEACA